MKIKNRGSCTLTVSQDNKRLETRKAVIDCIIENYLFRDSQVVSAFHNKIADYIKLNCNGSLSKSTWEIIYFLCNGLFSRSDVAVSDIYSSIAVSKSAVIRYLNRLEGWGLIEKRNDPKDKRRRILTFTPNFEESITAAIDHCAAHFDVFNQASGSTDRVDNEAVLRGRLARFKDFAEVSSDWFWETDNTHRFTWFSDSHWVYLKIGSSSRIGARRWEYHQPKTAHERLQMEKHREDIDAHRPFQDFVYRVNLENGNQIWCAINGNPVFDADGIFQGYIGSGRDVTSRREIVEEMRRSEDQLRRVLRLAADCSWTIDKNFKYTWFANGCRPLTQQTESELLGTVFWEHFTPSGNGRLEALDEIQALLRTHQPFHDYVSRTISGPEWSVCWHYSSGAPVFDDNGVFSGYQGVCRDATEQIRRDCLHATHKKVLRGIVDGLPTHKIIRDALNLFELLRPGTEAALFVRTEERFIVFDEINSVPDQFANPVSVSLVELLRRSLSERSNISNQASVHTRPDVQPFCLSENGDGASDQAQRWVLPFNYVDGTYNAAIMIGISSSGKFGANERSWLQEVCQMLELILMQRGAAVTQNVN